MLESLCYDVCWICSSMGASDGKGIVDMEKIRVEKENDDEDSLMWRRVVRRRLAGWLALGYDQGWLLAGAMMDVKN